MSETHDKAKQSCETCAFMRKRDWAVGITDIFACHRRAPTEGARYLRFPEVDKDDWCGEWERAE